MSDHANMTRIIPWDLLHLMAIGDSRNNVAEDPRYPQNRTEDEKEEEVPINLARPRNHHHWKLFSIKHVPVTRHVENQVQPEEKAIPVLALRRKTTFFGVLLVICQLAVVDTHHLLPVGIICYTVGIGIVLELLQSSDEHVLWHELFQYEEEIRHQRELRYREEFHRQQEIFRQEELQQVQLLVDFKFRVLQGKRTAPRVLVREENGHLMYYTE